jgi:hypothetical protein
MRKRFQKGQNSWVRVPVRMVPAARKLSTIEERRQDKNCLFLRGDYKNKGHNAEKLFWVGVPVKKFELSNFLAVILRAL